MNSVFLSVGEFQHYLLISVYVLSQGFPYCALSSVFLILPHVDFMKWALCVICCQFLEFYFVSEFMYLHFSLGNL